MHHKILQALRQIWCFVFEQKIFITSIVVLGSWFVGGWYLPLPRSLIASVQKDLFHPLSHII